MKKYGILFVIVAAVLFIADVSHAIMISELNSIYDTAVTDQYTEVQLQNIFDDIMEQYKSESEMDRENWKQAMIVLQEYAETQEDNVSQTIAIMLPVYIDRLSSVPEPSTIFLLGAGIAGIAFRRARVKK